MKKIDPAYARLDAAAGGAVAARIVSSSSLEWGLT